VTRVAFALAVLALLAGCGGDDEAGGAETTTAPAQMADVSVYFLRDGEVWPVRREVDTTGGEATAAIAALLQGPTAQEETDLDLTTAIPDTDEDAEVAIEDGVAELQLDVQLAPAGLAQVVYTLTRFPEVERVDVQEQIVTRADFEEQTPAILVESPLAFEEVASPLQASGTANTFEANFEYELTDTDGRIVDDSFVTATSGSGTRGTFDFTTDAYTVPFDGLGALIVFERSAEDGSRINLVEIPLRMTR
jgi:immunoglobulin-like protein involved in spore germination/sporulation and spore germination protein